ncbi:MAG: alpha/beta hydrolase [Tenericutes bacterium]|jgi:alpha-beta hydrolase superfamily lysophospholipase|nr:alpha/beta hydrolase [Mycoplasmatota bacterium]
MKQFILNDALNNDIHTYVYEPKQKPIGVLQIIHGASEHFARYGLFAEFMTKNGYVVVGHDILGHGLSTKTLDYVHFDDNDGDKIAFNSLNLVKEWIDQNYNNLPIYLLGHSMGSFLARKMVLDFPKAYEKAIFSGTAYPPKTLLNFGLFLTSFVKLFKGPKYVSKLIQDMSIDSNQKKMRKDGIINGINEEWLTRDTKIQDYYKHSPMCGQPFTVQANHDLFIWIKEANNIKRIKKANHHQPILFISGGHDPLSNYGKEIHKLVKKLRDLGYDQINMKIYPEARHEVLNELNKKSVYKDILNFIEK